MKRFFAAFPGYAFAACAAAALLTACAASDAPAASPTAARLIVGTVADWPDAAALAERAARIAGTPVSDVSPIAPRRYALTLRCADEAACARARQRLADDTSFAVDVEPAVRRTLPARPSASQAL